MDSKTLARYEARAQVFKALAHPSRLLIVDELMQSIASKGGSIDNTRAAVLACLHLADELQTAEKELKEYRQRVDTKSRMFSVLLDQVIG